MIRLICVPCFQANASRTRPCLGSYVGFLFLFFCFLFCDLRNGTNNDKHDREHRGQNQSPCLANQPVNMSDAGADPLRSTAGRTKDQAEQIIWLCPRKPTHFASVAAVMRSQ